MPETLLSSFFLTPPNNPERWVLLSLHFTDEETEDPSADSQSPGQKVADLRFQPRPLGSKEQESNGKNTAY